MRQEQRGATYFNGADVGILRGVFVLIESIFGKLAFLEIHTELDKEDHYRFQRCSGAIPRPLRCNMFIEDGKSSWRLLNGNKLLRSLRDNQIFRSFSA